MTRPSYEKIKEIAIDSMVVRSPAVSFLAEGEGNYNYLLEEDGRKLVLRCKKSDEVEFADSLAKEYILLRFLAAAGINNFPKAVHFDATHNVLIESFLAGETILLNELSDAQLQQYVECMHRVFSIDTDALANFCDQEGFPQPPSADLLRSIDVYGTKRLQAAKQGNWPIETEIIAWLEANLQQNYLLAQQHVDGRKTGLGIGDIQAEIILSESGEIQLFDLEHARYSHSIGLSYLKIHGNFSPEQFKTIVNTYATLSGTPKKELYAYMALEERLTRINDVIWAAMKWAETGEQQYHDLMYLRKAIAEKFLENAESGV